MAGIHEVYCIYTLKILCNSKRIFVLIAQRKRHGCMPAATLGEHFGNDTGNIPSKNCKQDKELTVEKKSPGRRPF